MEISICVNQPYTGCQWNFFKEICKNKIDNKIKKELKWKKEIHTIPLSDFNSKYLFVHPNKNDLLINI